jgi:hypothetical protein
MTEIAMHPAATQHLPGFITAPGETDVLFVGSVVFLIVLVMAAGSLYFWLHSIPERLAHGSSKIQFQLVAVLALLALFTHNNLFWVMALLLALIPIPDFWTPLASMADSLSRMVRQRDPRADEAIAIDGGSQPQLPLGGPVVVLTSVEPAPVEHGTLSDKENGAIAAAAGGHKP